MAVPVVIALGLSIGSLAVGLATLAGPLVISLYKKIKWIDDPSVSRVSKTTHDRPVPRGGGLVVAVGLVPALLASMWWPGSWGLWFGALILLISGTLDDHFDINPYIRFGLNVAAALAVVASGIKIDFVTNPFGSGVLDLGVIPIITALGTIVWIVWNINAVNWAKGLDGQLPGLVVVAGVVVGLLSLRFANDPSQGLVTIVAFALAGSYLGLLLWNAPPQRMMPGYAGGSLAGFFLAVLSILGGAKLATVLLLLAVPTTDGIVTVARRLLNRRSPFWGDRGHLHHRLLDRGWTRWQVASFYWLTSLVFGVLALQLDSRGKLYALLAAAILFVALWLWVSNNLWLGRFLKRRDRSSGSKT